VFDLKLINIGFGNMLNSDRLLAVLSPDSAPIKRIIQESKERGRLIDASHGRRTRAVLITDSDHVVLSYLQPETISSRLKSAEAEIDVEVESADE
jgi:regulator of extracellular matrix RemA (YlzA/DUF370 family)